MSIDSEHELEGLKRIGHIVALTLQLMKEKLRAGMTTQELDEIGRAHLEHHGARPAPKLMYDFPGATCISINDESAHGVPGERVIRQGDLVNVDVSAELDGFFADTGASIPVAPVSDHTHKLCTYAKRSLERAMVSARAGKPLNVIGRAIESEARRGGFQVIRNLCGHGLGRSLHEYPHDVCGYYDRTDKRRLTSGLVIAIEPFLSTGAHEVETADDGWTEKTPDGSLTAQYEHTVVITKRRPIVITRA